mmetsp:Transcript_46744/g.113926  ORF Transcript_46744/g.113926 Transcript_46744/m.113926 type:complete len:226 (-) Transcript_46744:951-1628(-)
MQLSKYPSLGVDETSNFWFVIFNIKKINILTSRRSSIPSPTPISFTGRFKSLLIATTLPPLADPSSLVRIRPVKPTSLFQTLAESNAIRPCAASRTNNDSCGTSRLGIGLFVSGSRSTDNRFWIVRLIFTNSCVNGALLLSRPDVSTRTVSYPSFKALSSAPYTTAEGEVIDSDGPYMSTSARSAHCCSCSTAPARNVSHAAIRTVWLPSFFNLCASLPIDVVLP